MRCNVKIVGIGKRRSGTSKAGRDYDFVPVSILFQDPEDHEFKGERAETLNVTFRQFNDSDMALGDTLDVVMHWQNYALQLDAVLN